MAYKIDVILDILKAIAFLDELSQFRIFKACMAYLTNTESNPLQGIEDAVFRTLIPRLQQEKEKELRLSLVRSQSGKKGGRKKANKANKANAFFASDKEAPLSSPSSSPSLSSPTPPSISPPIIPQEIPSPYAHMREAEFVERYREEGDGGMWANVALMLHLKSTAECITLFERFVMEYQHNGDEHQTYGDFKRHFLQWSRIAITKEQKYNGNNRSDYSKRGRADVPSDISLDF